MNVLGGFDGDSSGMIALERTGIKVDNYFASEIDKHAIEVSKDNYPNIIQVGDILKLKTETLPRIDLFIAGSPCQSLSRSGDNSGFDGKSGLFWEFIRVLNELKLINKDIKFLFENVVMKKEWEQIITDAIGAEPIEIDSTLVSGQKRQRKYWTNIPGVTMPENKGIVLASIVDGEREEIINHPLVLDLFNGTFLVRNATKKGYIEAHEGDSVNLEHPGSKTRRGRVGVGKTNTLNTACNYGMILNGKLVRLNINDYEALQTLPKDYTRVASENQRRKMIGNGWTIDVIAHIFKGLK